jgi:hypothetical protein
MSTDISESAQIIQFAAIRPKFGKQPSSQIPASNDEGKRDKPQGEEITDTGKNFRLRKQRHDRWLEADAIREYWRTSMKMDSAIFRVQNHGLPEGELHPEFNPQDHWRLLAKYREAFVRLMLTPAPDAQAVAWKRAALKAGKHKHTDLKTERIERAIADDVEFLRSHPVRQSRKPEQEQ